MGEAEVNEPILRQLVEAADSDGNSHLVVIPTGVLPSDVLLSSPIMNGGGGGERWGRQPHPEVEAEA